MGLNRWVGAGRLARTPELRRLPNGRAVFTNAIAVERNYREEDGSYPVDFVEFIAWDGRAETLAKFAEKGRMIGLSGPLQSYKRKSKKDGNEYTNWEIKVDDVQFLDSRSSRGGGASQQTEPDGYGDFAALEGEDEQLPW